MKTEIVEPLFRHQYGKMVSILTSIFGIDHLEMIEDAVQETFAKAVVSWRQKIPENPEAWLTLVAKNKTIDLIRRQVSENKRRTVFVNGSSTSHIDHYFDEKEAEDSQLKMIFLACHPKLNPQDQIAFALKTISGFSLQEIASALLSNYETIKKRFNRARRIIKEKNISFEIPLKNQLHNRLDQVLLVIYLIFNEGFHSSDKKQVVKEELCGEALRLCKFLLKNEELRCHQLYSLFALMCLHSSRLRSKTGLENEIIDLENQDRSLWYAPLIEMGLKSLSTARNYKGVSQYYFEAEIAAEHIQAKTFHTTNWKNILNWYERLESCYSSPMVLLNRSLVHLHLEQVSECKSILDRLSPKDFGLRAYLLHGTYAEYFIKTGDLEKAKAQLNQSLECSINETEKAFILKKRDSLKARLPNTP